ncbi:hypothetical protein M3B46_10165 [Sphingobacterium daejeonense]|uniref:hypothetical protein n=1 Tax=Sphingobacterium daejeonense TaxID=371142 RepID=UPI0021A3866E|nr:hypothetical protein [Sphingobacterium daejeonense]MCT1531361.1 hypothetical protein [Sphingobacterium daejeonense]
MNISRTRSDHLISGNHAILSNPFLTISLKHTIKEIIITWDVALFLVFLYFAIKYLYQNLFKIVTGCHDPFNPLYNYKDYPTWEKGYNKGRSDTLKDVNKTLAEIRCELEEIIQKYSDSSADNGEVQKNPEAEPAKKPTL